LTCLLVQPKMWVDARLFATDRPNDLASNGTTGRQITNFKSDTISSFRFSPDGKTMGVLRSHSESDVVLLRDAGFPPQ